MPRKKKEKFELELIGDLFKGTSIRIINQPESIGRGGGYIGQYFGVNFFSDKNPDVELDKERGCVDVCLQGTDTEYDNELSDPLDFFTLCRTIAGFCRLCNQKGYVLVVDRSDNIGEL